MSCKAIELTLANSKAIQMVIEDLSAVRLDGNGEQEARL